MKSTISNNERYTILTINEKNLTNQNSSDLKSEITFLVSEGVKSILMNLSQIDFIDSSGLSAILSSNRIMDEHDGFLVIYGLNEENLNLIKIAKLDKVLSIASSEKEAVDLIVLEELERDLDLNIENE